MNVLPLRVKAPAHRAAEFAWVCDVLFGRWLGLPHVVEVHEQAFVSVQAGPGELRWSDAFFSQADARWLQADSLPAVPPPMWPLPDDALRLAIGQDSVPRFHGDGAFEQAPGRVQLPIDITGSVFFMLSRYEEAVAGAPADRHGRFPGAMGVVHRAGLALRPLVDEWVEVLWWALQQVAPGLQRRARTADTWVSCDVDAPYSPGGRSLPLALRQAAGHLVHERSPRRAAQSLLHAAASRVGVTRHDPYDSFDWMMDVNERAGRRITFYFLSVRQPQRIDGGYELGEPALQSLMSRIVQRGHEVGLHGSYRSVDEPALLAREFEDLRAAVARAGGQQARYGARQHYLRWRMADTAAQLDALGFEHDSTLGYPDVAGFRCGTSHTFPLFDLTQQRALAIVERPLVLMEATVLSPTYLGLGDGDAARALMMQLRASCHRFGGTFGLLWHNSNFATPRARRLYEALLQ